MDDLHASLDRTDALIVAAIAAIGAVAILFAVYQNRQQFVNWRTGFRAGLEKTVDELGDQLRAEEGLPMAADMSGPDA